MGRASNLARLPCTNGWNRVIMVEGARRGAHFDGSYLLNGVTMTVEQASSPENGLDEVVEVTSTVDHRRRLDQLSPLIHELIAWDLVYCDETGNFVLHDDVQSRLREVAALRFDAIAEVYVGRQCQQCGVVGVTRLIEGVRICSACSRAAKDQVADPTERPPVRRSRWHRKAG